MNMELDENNNSVNNARSIECCAKRLGASRCPSSTSTLQSLYDLRQNNLLCDAVIRLEDGGVFPIHRAILSACSSYFRTLFTTTLHTEKRTDFLIPNVNSHNMNQLLDYAYLHRLEVNKGNVCQLLVSADYLGVLGVLELCCDYLKRNLMPENCVGIMLFAREHFCRRLETEARRYIFKNFTEIAERSSEILTLSVADLKALIGADELNVKNEEDTWELVLRWIDHDPTNRKPHVAELMSQVRLGLLETQYFMENVKEHPYVAGNEACRPIVIEALKFIYELETFTYSTEKTPTPKIGRPRIPYEILFAIGGWTSDVATNYMETYDTRADRWVKVRNRGGAGRSVRAKGSSRLRRHRQQHLRDWWIRRAQFLQQLSMLQRRYEDLARNCADERQKVLRERDRIERHGLRDGRLRRTPPAIERRALRLPAQPVVPHHPNALSAIRRRLRHPRRQNLRGRRLQRRRRVAQHGRVLRSSRQPVDPRRPHEIETQRALLHRLSRLRLRDRWLQWNLERDAEREVRAVEQPVDPNGRHVHAAQQFRTRAHRRPHLRHRWFRQLLHEPRRVLRRRDQSVVQSRGHAGEPFWSIGLRAGGPAERARLPAQETRAIARGESSATEQEQPQSVNMRRTSRIDKFWRYKIFRWLV